MKHAQLVILSGPSGVGKDTIVKGVMEKMKNVGLSVSYTTRPKRKNNGVWEQNGVEYWFMDSKEQFEQEAEKGTFLEYALYNGDWYGTSQRYLEELEQQGCETIFLTIETNGAAQVKARDPRAVSIFLMPPTPQTLVERLKGRDSEVEKERKKRLAEGSREVKRAYAYDYIVVNDDLEKAVDEVICIIRSIHLRTARQLHEADRVNRLFMELDNRTDP